MAVWCPLSELDLREDLGLEPHTIFHLFPGEYPLRTAPLGQIGKRAGGSLQRFHLCHHRAPHMRHKAGANFSSKEQLVAVVMSDDHRIEWIAGRVSADDELLTFIDLVFGPGIAAAPRLVQGIISFGDDAFEA